MSFPSDVAAFSTRSLKATDSVRAWRKHLAEVYFRLDVVPHDRNHIDGSLHKRVLGNIKISELRGSKQSMVRTTQQAKLDNVESFIFISPVTGDFSYRHRNVEDLAAYGQIFALASAEFHEVSISDNSRMLCLRYLITS